MRLPRLLALATLCSSLVAATAARAQWPAGGKPVAVPGTSSKGIAYVRMFDLPSGDHYIMTGVQQSTYRDYTLSRMDGTGSTPPGYPAYVDIKGAFQSNSTEQRGFAVNDSGYFLYSSWSGSTLSPECVIVQAVHPDGYTLPDNTGWKLDPNQARYTSAIAPGAGSDMYVLSGANRLRRLLRSGVQGPGWPVNGINITAGTEYMNSALVADGTGGVVWFAPYGTAQRPCALRVDSTGLRHAGWPATGELVLSNDPQDAEFDVDFQTDFIRQPLVRSGSTHCIAAWSKRDGNTPRHIKIQRFSLDGVVDPNWPAGGILLAQPVDSAGVTLIADGEGGAFVFWYQNGWPVGTHVLASGQVQGAPAASLLPAGASYVRSRVQAVPSSPISYVMVDRTSDGRVVFAWEEDTPPGAPQIRVRWLLPDLTPDPSEPSAGRLVLPVLPSPNRFFRGLRVVHADDAGGAFVGWDVFYRYNDNMPDVGQVELWMTRLLPSALVDAPRTPPGATAIALSAPRPNPARDVVDVDLALSTDVPARLELLDVAGRTLRTQAVPGAGRHSLAFTNLRDLPPGLYFVRATAGGAMQASRLVLTR